MATIVAGIILILWPIVFKKPPASLIAVVAGENFLPNIDAALACAESLTCTET